MPFKGINQTCKRCRSVMDMSARRTKDKWQKAILVLTCKKCGHTTTSKANRAERKAEELLADKPNSSRLTLKWGTLKAWDFTGIPEAEKLLKRYGEIGAKDSAMEQHDTPEQKAIICKIIDLMPGTIYLAWKGNHVSKAEAKKYVLTYGTERTA